MKNKNPNGLNESIFEKKGFYIALYCTIGALLVGTIGISYASMRGSEDQNIAQEEFIDTSEIYPTGSQSDKSYLIDRELASMDIGDFNLGFIPEEESDDLDVYVREDDTELDEETNQSSSPEEVIADPVFNVFEGNQEMLWPVIGDVVMDYSSDRVIYDTTLEQYRTNDSISISAPQGENVVAAADGIVSNVENTRRDGNVVTIDHGNGWATTYTQLQEGVLVAVGDVVAVGEVIGVVDEPSIFTGGLGNHVGFRVTRDGQSVNPNHILSQIIN